MLSENKLLILKDLTQQYSREEIIWAKGYLAGILEQNQPQSNGVSIPAVALKPTIIYGTETGNSKKLASQLQALLKKNKIQSKAVDAFQYPLEKIEKEDFLILIISTQGEGEPPLNAIKFFDNLSNSSFNLSKTQFMVFGLGDSSYPFFCKAGEDIDEILKRLGAKQLLPLQKSDVDYLPVAESWFNEVLKMIQNSGIPSSLRTAPKKVIESITSHKKIHTGIVKHKVILNDNGSNKETHHIEIVPDEDIVYEPGDAIGFYPKNTEKETEKIASFFNEKQKRALLIDKNIKGLSSKSLVAFSKLLKVEITEEKADLLDVLKKYPVSDSVSFDEVLALLHPIAPRLYSVSSDFEAHEGEVHLTVCLDTFIVEGKRKTGFCSQFLAEYPKETSIEFYVHKNQNFKLPQGDKDIIMIGPGTGIAPFRSFLAHRDVSGAEGKNWLFFGEQHFISDFYYQTDIQEWLSTGVLTQLDTAFSRDQKHKIYVQDRLKQRAKEVYEWIENGAYLYVCGQKENMSTDVENILIEIIAAEKNINISEAKEVLEALETEGRYQKDVY